VRWNAKLCWLCEQIIPSSSSAIVIEAHLCLQQNFATYTIPNGLLRPRKSSVVFSIEVYQNLQEIVLAFWHIGDAHFVPLQRPQHWASACPTGKVR